MRIGAVATMPTRPAAEDSTRDEIRHSQSEHLNRALRQYVVLDVGTVTTTAAHAAEAPFEKTGYLFNPLTGRITSEFVLSFFWQQSSDFSHWSPSAFMVINSNAYTCM